MGGNASSERRVSFGVDDEDRVRVLRGVRLSDSIVSRMRESSKDQKPSPSSGSVRSSGTHPPRSIPDPRPEAEGIRDPPAGGDRHKLSDTDDDLYRRYEVEQAIIQEELARLAKRERETAQKRISSSIQQEKLHGHQERRRAEQLAKELERKDAELKHLDGFYKEQLTSIEKKNLEIYRMTAEQFHTAATNAEYRVKQRSYDPVCMDIQSNILKCYRENQQELLSCSNLAKEYRRCVLEAQKNLLFNHG